LPESRLPEPRSLAPRSPVALSPFRPRPTVARALFGTPLVLAGLLVLTAATPARADATAPAATAPAAAPAVTSAAAPATPSVAVELNRLEDAGGGCRLTLVVGNPGTAHYETLKLDLVLFDSDGVVARRLAVETGPVRPNKTVVRLFEAADLACAGIGRLLLNDVVACSDAGGPVAGCVDRLAPSTRTTVPFDR